MPKAKNLKYCRQKAGLTQQALADAIGNAKSTINAWETRKRAIPVPNTKRIAEYFGVSYTEFCDVDLEALDQEFLDKQVTLSPSEAKHILMFRELPDDIKAAIRVQVISTYKLVKTEEAEDKDESEE